MQSIFTRRKGVTVISALAVIVAGWITFTLVFILREPARGAPSLESLRTRSQSAIEHADDTKLGLLFEEGSASDSYASDYLGRVQALKAGQVVVRTDGSALVVVVRGHTGAVACNEWLAHRDGDRWLLDGGSAPVSVSKCVL